MREKESEKKIGENSKIKIDKETKKSIKNQKIKKKLSNLPVMLSQRIRDVIIRPKGAKRVSNSL